MDEAEVSRNLEIDPLEPAERARSNFVRDIVQQRERIPNDAMMWSGTVPKRVVQFWDDLRHLPEDVQTCMKSWMRLEREGFKVEVFDKRSASDFIRSRLGTRYCHAFDECYHPSMMSDYFRYSYIFVEGGFYIDADDVYHGTGIDHLFTDKRLKLQPFCYDLATSQMIAPSVFTKPGANEPGWIFYFNTTPLIAPSRHPIVERALMNATDSLEAAKTNGLPEVQATTGPGNLTRSIFEVISEGCSLEAVMVAHDWELTSTSQWPLSYRNDSRNWRLSNQQAYRALPHADVR